MDRESIRQLLEAVAAGDHTVDSALEKLRDLPFEDIEGVARIDHHRTLRRGYPEVVLGQFKTPGEISAIVERFRARNLPVMVTRVNREILPAVQHLSPRFFDRAGILFFGDPPAEPRGAVAVVTAGTSDISVAEEAAVTAEMFGSRVIRLFDVGVAGIHRLLSSLDSLREANCIVVAAGMEGALPSVVGGLVACPVVAVPTSVGYGAAFGGVAPLLGMLNSCSPGVAVVNIDNGFGAGYLANMINLRGWDTTGKPSAGV